MKITPLKLFVTMSLVLAGACQVEAATLTWTAASGNWSTTSDWTSGTAPSTSSTDNLYFNTASVSSTNDITGLTVGNVTLGSAATGTYSGNDIALTGSLIANNTSNTWAINTALSSATNGITVWNGKTLTVTGTLSGTGALVIGGTNSSYYGSVYLTNSSNTYSGATYLTQGSLYVNYLADAGVASSLGTSGTLYIGNTNNTRSSYLYYTGTAATSNLAINYLVSSSNSNIYFYNNGGYTLTLTGNWTGCATGSNYTAVLNFNQTSAYQIIINGNIADASSTVQTQLSLANRGYLTLGGSNTFSGGISLTNYGRVAYTSVDALGTGTITSTGGVGTVLDTQVSGTINNAICLAGTTGYMNFYLNGYTATFAGVVTATAGEYMMVQGPGSLTLTNSNNAISSGIQINYTAATVVIGAQGAAGTGYLQTNKSGATFGVGYTGTLANAIIINGAYMLYLDTGTNAVTYTGTVSTTSASQSWLKKTGAGTLILTSTTGTSNWGLQLDSGTVEYTNVYALCGTNNIQFTGNSTLQAGVSGTLGDAAGTSGTVTLSSGVLAQIDSNGYDMTISKVISANTTGTLAKIGAGELTLNYSGTSTFRNLAVTGGTLAISSAVSASTSRLTINTNGGDANISGNIVAAAGLTKSGAGTLTLSGSNAYTGTTTLEAGILAVDNANALSSSTLTFTGGTAQFGVSSSFANVINNSTSAISIDTNGQSVTFAGAIDSSNTGGLTKLGSGTLTLGATETYSGITEVVSGELKIDSGASLSASSTVKVDAGATLSGAGTVNGAVNVTSGTINGSGLSLGTTTLEGTSTLSGVNTAASVTVTSGTTLLTGTTTASSGLTVSLGATLNSNGIINANAIVSGLLKGTGTINGNLALSGTLAPGNSGAGATTINGNLTMDSSAILVMEVMGSSHDEVIVSGAVTLAGTLDLSSLSGLSLGETITLIDNTGSSTTSGYFTEIITSGSTYYVTGSSSTYTISVSGTVYVLSYSANADGDSAFNDVTLTVVPEPSTWAILVGGLGMLAFVQRIRCRQS